MINLVPVTPKHYEFVRALRTDPRTQGAFLEQENITAPQQTRYMDRYSKYYYICILHGDPCGYVGVINDDIRICSHPDYQRKGVGYAPEQVGHEVHATVDGEDPEGGGL